MDWIMDHFGLVMLIFIVIMILCFGVGLWGLNQILSDPKAIGEYIHQINLGLQGK